MLSGPFWPTNNNNKGPTYHVLVKKINKYWILPNLIVNCGIIWTLTSIIINVVLFYIEDKNVQVLYKCN